MKCFSLSLLKKAFNLWHLNFFLLPFLIINFLFSDESFSTERSNSEYNHWIDKTKLGFIENKGQIVNELGLPATEVLFTLSVNGLDIYITYSGISYVFSKIELIQKSNKEARGAEVIDKVGKYRMDMNLKGASIKKENIEMALPVRDGYTNYYLAHCPNGITGLMAHRKLIIKNIYEGIDWILYSDNNEGLKYDFIVHPGSDPSVISLNYKGAEKIEVQDESSSLLIITPLGEIREGTIYSYEASSKNEIVSRYKLKNGEVSFELGDYNRNQTLVIDPPLLWGTYYGGTTSEENNAATVDANGNIYITGYISSSTAVFPTQNLTGAYWQPTSGGSSDMFVLKFNSSGVRQWCTYYGGAGGDFSTFITTDAFGNVYITGYTSSSNFPVQASANLSAYYQGSHAGGSFDAFILKFDNAGVRIWSTYYGGTGSDQAWSMNVDVNGNIYIAGSTSSTDFPVMSKSGAYNQSSNSGLKDAFIVKFSSALIRQWATYYGGTTDDTAYEITTNTIGAVYVIGYTTSTSIPLLAPASPLGYFQNTYGGGSYDAFILLFNAANVPRWATYYGGSDDDLGFSITTDSNNEVYFTGYTESTDFPVQALPAAFYQGTKAASNDIFIVRFNSSEERQWATYYGGDFFEKGLSIITDASDNIYITGETYSTDFPTYNPGGAYYQGSSGGGYDAFILKFNNSGARQWATYYGGSMNDYSSFAAIDDSNNFLYIVGKTPSSSATFPTQNYAGAYNQMSNGGTTDAFIAKFGDTPLPIELLSFEGVNKNNTNILGWITATETNNDYFVVERSFDGVFFEDLGIVDGGGSSTVLLSYKYVDEKPLFGINFYRLKQVDWNGKFDYSFVIAVENKAENIALENVYVNQFDQQLNYQISSQETKDINVSIVDLLGNSLKNEPIKLSKGMNIFTSSISCLAQGIYFLGINNKSYMKFIKLN